MIPGYYGSDLLSVCSQWWCGSCGWHHLQGKETGLRRQPWGMPVLAINVKDEVVPVCLRSISIQSHSPLLSQRPLSIIMSLEGTAALNHEQYTTFSKCRESGSIEWWIFSWKHFIMMVSLLGQIRDLLCFRSFWMGKPGRWNMLHVLPLFMNSNHPCWQRWTRKIMAQSCCSTSTCTQVAFYERPFHQGTDGNAQN